MADNARNGILGELPITLPRNPAAPARQPWQMTRPQMTPPSGPGVVNTRYARALDLINDRRVAAFLGMLRDLETGNNYDRVVGSTMPTGFERHPNIYNKKQDSTSAGAYQFNIKSWRDQVRDLNLKDFTPLSQDVAAVNLLSDLDAIAPLLSGNLDGAIFAAARRWDSLPLNKTGKSKWGHPRSLDTAKTAYNRDGGALP